MRWPGKASAPCNAECAGPLCSLTHHPAASQTGRAFTPACRCAGSSPCPAWHQMCAESKSARLHQQKQKARRPRQRGCCVLTAVMRAGHGTMVPTLTLPMGQSKAGAQCYRRCHADMHQAPAAPHRSQTAHLVLRVGPMCSFDCDKSEQAAPVVVSQQLSLFKGGEQTLPKCGLRYEPLAGCKWPGQLVQHNRSNRHEAQRAACPDAGVELAGTCMPCRKPSALQ